jgi:hypothetical protein
MRKSLWRYSMPRPREEMETQMYSWVRAMQEYKKTETERKEKCSPFVTISRECGTYGTTIAGLLVEYLREHEHHGAVSWVVFDKELIQKVMEEHKFPARFVSYFAESSAPRIRDILEELFGLHPPRETLVLSMSKTILHLASLGHVIVVGRGANIVTRKLPNGVHVRLVGSFEKRLAHMKEYLKLPEREAREYILKEDDDRRAYVKRYFQKDISDVSLYDLTINTNRVSLQEAVMTIGNMVLMRCK